MLFMSACLLIGLRSSQKFPPRLSVGELSFELFIYLSICVSASVPQHKDMHEHVPQICLRFAMRVLSRSPPLRSQRDISDNHQIGALTKR